MRQRERVMTRKICMEHIPTTNGECLVRGEVKRKDRRVARAHPGERGENRAYLHVSRESHQQSACAPHVHVDTPDDGEEPSSDREVKRLTEYGDTTHLAGDGRRKGASDDVTRSTLTLSSHQSELHNVKNAAGPGGLCSP